MVLADFFIWLFNIEKIGNRYIPRDPGKLTSMLASLFLILLLISLSIASGLYMFWKNQQFFSEKSQTVCVLQGDLPIKATRGAKLDIKLAKKTYEELIQNNEGVLFIAPEGSLPTNFSGDYITQKWIKDLALKKQSDLIFGSYCKDQEKFTNCAIFSNSAENKFSYYEKERLVPFGEFIPMSFLLPEFLKKLASFSIGEGFSEGKQNVPFATSLGKVGTTICFELIFPSIVRRRVLDGSELLINLSDLSWFSNIRVRQQFLGFAVFRAIENRRPVIISSNSGISSFIEPSGKIKSQSIPDTQGTLIDWVNPNNKITFYAKYGW
jgi:apolipoprotein N-acyltransferase